MAELSIPHQVEPRNRYADSENQPDIVAFDSSDYSSMELDISVAHPCSCDALKGAATKSGYDAEKRDRKKHQKYDQQLGDPVWMSLIHPACL